MRNSIVSKTGKLLKRFLPAIYFDTSVIIDYWMTEGMEVHDTEMERLLKYNECPSYSIVRTILKSDERIQKVLEIRRKLSYEIIKVTPVVSPLAVLELIEWYAEVAFKEIASEASGVVIIQRRNKKQIGEYLKKAIELRKAEIKNQKDKKRGYTTGLEDLMSSTWLNSSFARAHGLFGLLQVDIVNFHLTISKVWQEPSAYAYLQLGATDTMHILLAQHLGCQYIASFDSDFMRVKDIISKETGISLLTSPQEILDTLG